MAEGKRVKRAVPLSRDECKKSRKLAMKLLYAEGPTGDWRSTGTKRNIERYIADTALGKLAEIEGLVPGLKEISARIAVFFLRGGCGKVARVSQGEDVFDPEKPKRKLSRAKMDNKANPMNRLRKKKIAGA